VKGHICGGSCDEYRMQGADGGGGVWAQLQDISAVQAAVNRTVL
jgi:hypothetical protein